MAENVSICQQMSLLPLGTKCFVSTEDDGEHESNFTKTPLSHWVQTISLWYEEIQRRLQKRERISVSPFYREHSGFQITWRPSDTSGTAAPGGRLKNVVQGASPQSVQRHSDSPKPTELKGSSSARKLKARAAGR